MPTPDAPIIRTCTSSESTSAMVVLSPLLAVFVVVMLCFYDAENAMIAMDEDARIFDVGDQDYIEVEADVPDEAVDYRLFVWEGLSSLDTSLNVLD